jgi:hypothetical protein
MSASLLITNLIAVILNLMKEIQEIALSQEHLKVEKKSREIFIQFMRKLLSKTTIT